MFFSFSLFGALIKVNFLLRFWGRLKKVFYVATLVHVEASEKLRPASERKESDGSVLSVSIGGVGNCKWAAFKEVVITISSITSHHPPTVTRASELKQWVQGRSGNYSH